MGWSRLPWHEDYERPLDPPDSFWEAESMYTCACCGQDILEGDDYYEVDGSIYCEDCVEHRVAGEEW